MVWTRQEARPRLRRKKDSGDGTTWKKKARKTEAVMDDCINPDMRAIGTTTDEIHDRIVSAAANPQPSGSGWKKKKILCRNDAC